MATEPPHAVGVGSDGARVEADAVGVDVTIPDRPPRARLTLRVGVTGHRAGALADVDRGALAGAVAAVLEALRGAVEEGEGDGPSPRVRLVSPLAEGADRIAAHAALARGIDLQCPLPFSREEYERDFDGEASVAEFRALLARASAVLELDGDRATDAGRLDAYHEVGRATLDHADILLAVWDGGHNPKEGSVEGVVREAGRRVLPTVWVEPHSGEVRVRLGGGGFRPAGDLAEAARALVHAAGRAPADPEAEAAYRAERERTRSFRGMFWKFFRDLLRTPPRWRLSSRVSPLSASAREWRKDWHAAPGLPERVRRHIDAALLPHFAWTDHLARYYVNLYRSASVTIYALAALAVALALAPYGLGLTADPERNHEALLLWTSAELFALVAIMLIFSGSRRGRWHLRYLQYRLLAEQFRTLKFLACLGRTLPGPALRRHWLGPEARRSWVGRYFLAVEADAGLPPARLGPGHLAAFRAYLRGGVLGGHPDASGRPGGQIGFHREVAEGLETVDHKLHLIETGMFVAAVVACMLHLFLHDAWLTCCAAFFPAVGAAVAGVRNQGDFPRVIQRSERMADRLHEYAEELDALGPEPDSRELAGVADAVAGCMLTEVLEWQFLFQPVAIKPP